MLYDGEIFARVPVLARFQIITTLVLDLDDLPDDSQEELDRILREKSRPHRSFSVLACLEKSMVTADSPE